MDFCLIIVFGPKGAKEDPQKFRKAKSKKRKKARKTCRKRQKNARKKTPKKTKKRLKTSSFVRVSSRILEEKRRNLLGN